MGEVSKQVYDFLKQEIDELTERDVRDLIAGKYNQRMATKPELERRLSDLKLEAKLINQLEDLENGVEPLTERAKVKHNQRIVDLKNKIAEFRKSKGNTEEILINAKKRNEDEIKKIEDDIANKRFDDKPRKQSIETDEKLRKQYPELWKETMDAIIRKKEARDKWRL